MTKENRGGGEPTNGGEVDFDAILGQVVEETGAKAREEMVKAETRKKSKSRRAEIAGELGGHLEGLTTKGGVESEQELVATAFNALVYSEYHNKKIPEAVQTKLDAYNQAREKHAEATKKMANLPDNLQGDSRLQTALDKLKSDMVAQAKTLAGELGVDYKEIAKGETALLSTDDAEIVRLREEADKLSPGKVEYAKESYEDYKERIAEILKERMAGRMNEIAEGALVENKLKKSENISGQYKQQLVFSDRVDNKQREDIETDEETLKRSVALLTQEELKKVFDAIEVGEPDEAKRRSAIDRLSRLFGQMLVKEGATSFGSDKGGQVFLRSGSIEESKQPTPSWMIDAAYAESKIEFMMQSICSRQSDQYGQGGSLQYGHDVDGMHKTMFFLRKLKENPDGFKIEQWNVGERQTVAIRNPEIRIFYGDDLEKDPALTDLAIKAGSIWKKLRSPYSFGDNYLEQGDNFISSVLFREIKRINSFQRSLNAEQGRESGRWGRALDVAINKHEPTNQDVVDKATKPDGTVRLDNPEKMKAMIAVLQEQLNGALEVAAGKVEKSGEQESEIYKLKRSLADLTRLKDQLSEENKTLKEQITSWRDEYEKQSQVFKSRTDLADKEKQRVEGEKMALRRLIAEAIGKLEVQKTKGLPILGGAKELAERQRVIDDIKQRAGIK